ncbi:MAG: PKD domain-containing protein, partial [Candidatus Omnitrophota bacterium]
PEIAPKVVSPELVRLPQAFIMAKPIKGYSPLKVRFYGNKSFSPSGKIVSYLWDFGDGDTSIKINPMNTFYSTTFEPKYFIVTLTVFDNLGNTAAAKTTIEVLNK